jgi:hypothetical protein
MMKIVLFVFMVVLFSACGSGGDNAANPPASPHVNDADKIPPAVPKID